MTKKTRGSKQGENKGCCQVRHGLQWGGGSIAVGWAYRGGVADCARLAAAFANQLQGQFTLRRHSVQVLLPVGILTHAIQACMKQTVRR